MREYSFRKDGFTFERVSKATARRVYKNGLTVVICPVNINPLAFFGSFFYEINRKHREHLIIDESGIDNDFTNYINSFEYYNCTTNETGRYTAFYIPVKEVDRFTGEAPTAATLGTVKQYDHNFMN